MSEIQKVFRHKVHGLGLSLSEQQLARFARYEQLVAEWNQRISLTTVADIPGIWERHFFDSLSCVLATGKLHGLRLVDVGSGAGFPGLPLKIVFPGIEVTLVESVGKKARFLELVLRELRLDKASILSDRAEILGQRAQYRENFDWAVSRAVAPLAVLSEYLLPLTRIGGHMLAMKGASLAEEVAAAQYAIKLLGGAEPRVIDLSVLGLGLEGKLVVVEKITATPPHYPRRTGVPAKRPLLT